MVNYRFKNGRKEWYYEIPKPGSTRSKRLRDREYGFATKREAEKAEAKRKVELDREACLTNAGLAPATLDLLIEKFFALHCNGPQPLAGKTRQRYREHKTYLSPQFLALAPIKVTKLQCTAEWTRLLECGGRDRWTKLPKPLSPATALHVANLVSIAYNWGNKQEFWTGHINPVKISQKPKVAKREAQALQPSDALKVLSHANKRGWWCRQTYLHAADALGCRRGELLALRWPDLSGGIFRIWRSLTQYEDEKGQMKIEFKPTKEDEIHYVSAPEDLLEALWAHREKQREFQRAFGKDYAKNPEDRDLIFCREDGSRMPPDAVTDLVSHLMKRVGLPKGASLHSFRHTHASALIESGVPITTVSKRMGHADLPTTAKIYSHVINKGEDRKAAETYADYRKKRTELVQ